MAWYRNHYHCSDCGCGWEDEWSCCCDDECPACGSRNWSPLKSENLTEVICQAGSRFAVYQSPDSAEHNPGYKPIAEFTSIELAAKFIREGELT